MTQRTMKKKKAPFIVYLLWLGFMIAVLCTFYTLNKPLAKQASKLPKKPGATKQAPQNKHNPRDNTYSSSNENFIVIASNPNTAYGILLKADEYLSNENIGISYSSFPGQVTIRVFNSAKDYRNNTNMPSWSRGYADVAQSKICIINDYQNNSALAHEISHISFGNYINQATPYALMLNEGLASVEQMRYDLNLKIYMQYRLDEIKKGNFTPLPELGSVNVDQENNQTVVEIWYTQCASVVYFLQSRYGMAKFSLLMKELKNYVSFENAIADVYGIRTVSDLQNLWLDDLNKSRTYF